MNPSPRSNEQLEAKLNSIDPSPHVKRFVEITASCPKCGLGLYISSKGLIVACGNGHTFTWPEMEDKGGF